MGGLGENLVFVSKPVDEKHPRSPSAMIIILYLIRITHYGKCHKPQNTRCYKEFPNSITSNLDKH